MTTPEVPEDVLATTRASWQALAEHVLSKARHVQTGRIGLRATPGGIGTPPFPSPDDADGDQERQLRIDGTDLVLVDGDREERAPITTIRAAADLAGIEAGAPADVYTPHTPLDLDAPLTVDAGAAALIASWYELVNDALEVLRSEHVGDEPTIVQLWPEHFDLAISIGECNFGGSPGDDSIRQPYLYVGPWSPPEPDGDFWTEPFGAARTRDQVPDLDAAVAFFRDGLQRQH